MKRITYWGVLCRKCLDPIVFGSPSHPQFRVETEFARPGTVCCPNGHEFIYFPRDFKFFESELEIPEVAMQRNRETHRAVNPIRVMQSGTIYGKRWVPEEEKAAAGTAPPAAAKPLPMMRAIDGPDPRRASAQEAAKAMWARWAARKVS